MWGNLFDAYGRWVFRHRLIAAAIVLALTLLAGFSILERSREGLPLDFTPQALFEDDSDELHVLREIESVFGREDNDLMLLLSGPIGTPEGVAAVRALHAALAAHPRVERVDSLVNATVSESDPAAGLRVLRPLDELAPAEAVARVAADPLLGRLVVSTDGDTAALWARIDRRIVPISELGPVVEELSAAARAVPLPPGLTLRLTGVPWIRAEVVDMMLSDQTRFVPLVAGLFLVVTLALFRRPGSALGPLVSVLLAGVWSVGLLLGAGATLNVLSILVPTLVVVIGASDSIHLVARYQEELEHEPDRARALGLTLRHLSVACFLTSFTTATGFASLIIAKTKIIRDFGVHCSVAVMIAWVATMVALPVWLAFLPSSQIGPLKGTAPRWSLGMLARIERWVARGPRRVIAATMALCAGLLWLGSGVQTNNHLLEMYSGEHPTREAIGVAESEMAGVVPVMVHVRGEPGALLEPDNLRRMAEVEAALRARPMVRWSASLAGQVQTLHQRLSGEAGLPASREAVAQELLVAELGGELPEEWLVNSDYSRARVLAICADAGGREFLRLQAEVQAEADAAFAGSGLEVVVSGDGVVASLGLDRLITDLYSSIAIDFAVILVAMGLLLRSARLAVIAIVPNAVPLLFTLGTLAVLGIDLQITNIVSFTVALGIAVDDTIHFMVRYGEELRAGYPQPEALSRTFQGSGIPMLMTSALLLVGFGVLASSPLTSTKHFGMLNVVTMTAAIVGDLFLLPALLRVFDRGDATANTPG